MKQIPNNRQQASFSSFQLLASSFLLPASCLLLLFLSIVCSLWPNLCLAQEDEPPLSYYEIIEQRNFFRPKSEGVVDKQKQNSQQEKALFQEFPLKTSDLVLTGVVKIKGNYKAILEKKSSGKSFYIKVNDAVEGYTVKDIQQDKIIFQRNGQEFILNIEKTDSSDTVKPQEESKGKIEPNKQSPSPDQIKYEGSMMQKLRMGTGGQ